MDLSYIFKEACKSWVFFATDIPPDEFYSIWWSQCLCWLTYFNIVLLAAVLYPYVYRVGVAPTPPIQCKGGFWAVVYKLQPLLAIVYVTACGIRGIWPRMDELRVCFYDRTVSVVAIGRTLATIGELSFCAQICLAMLSVSNNLAVANVLMAANVVAQSCCWYSVITQDQRGHTVEESIWLCTGLIWTIVCFGVKETTSFSSSAKLFRHGMLIAGPFYVLFMSLVDVPMYYNRFAYDTSIGRVYQTVEAGLAEIMACKAVSQKDSFWVPEMPWMTLYFSCAVWTSIWLAQADIRVEVASVVTHDKKKI